MTKLFHVLAFACIATAASAACDPTPHERFAMIEQPDAKLLGERCDLVADTAATVELSCTGRVYHLARVQP